MVDLVLAIIGIFLVIAIFAILSVIMLTRPRNMRKDPNREGGELDGHIVVKDWNKEE